LHFLENLPDLAAELAKVAPTRFYGVPLVYGRIPQGILKKIPQSRLDLLNAIPVVRGMVRRRILEGAGLQNAQVFISGSAPLPLPVLEWFKKNLGIEICQGYSMTENMLYATSNVPGQNRIGSVGRPLPGCELRLSEEGEILIRHPGVMTGYFKDPEKTAETLTPDGWLRTGDKGRIDDDGYVYITGRVKEIFKTLKGKYVAPAPIEGALTGNAHVDQLCLVGSGLNQPLMLVTLTEDALAKPREEVEQSLLADVEEVNRPLEPHEKIGKIVVLHDTWTIDNGFMTPTMKVKREQVESHYGDVVAKEAEVRDNIAWA
jgi:long-chain acyl-CoA synthetase